MADLRKLGSTSNIVRLLLTKSTDGTAFTGASNSSSGLIVSTIADNEATATAYTVAGSNVETITTLGTWSAPTTGKCRFREVDATNHPGLYELHFSDSRFSVSNAKRLLITISGVTGLFPAHYEIQLTQADVYDAVRLGLTALPNVASGSAGALLVDGTGTAAISTSAGKVLLQATQTGVTIPTVTTLTTLPSITSNWLTAAGIAAGALNGKGDWNIGKTGYALSTAGVQAIWDAATSLLTTVGSIGKLLVDNINATISSRSTYAGGDTSGTQTLLTRIVGTLASGTHSPQSGDSFARLGAPLLNNISIADDLSFIRAEAISDRDAILNTIPVTDTAAIKAKTDNLPSDPADQSIIIAATDSILTAVGTRLAASAYTAPPSAETISAQVASDLAAAHGSGSWLAVTGFATAVELAKVLKTGEQFTATDGTGSKNVTFTRVV